jgi:hypothetical protein
MFGEADDVRAVVLVEGVSDQRALDALALRRGRSLAAEGIRIVPIGGAQSIGRYLELAAARAPEVKLAGLCDAAVCEPDLEVELIRSLGAASVETVLQAQGDLHSFRTFQKQPAQQGRTIEAQLRRFLGTRAGRKAQYARVLVDALDLAQVPRPLEGALAHV